MLAYGTTPIVLIKIGTAGEPVSHLADAALVALPKAPHRIAIFAVPFGPEHGKISDLIAAFAHVPRFRDQLHLREHRVLVNNLEKGVQLVHAFVDRAPGWKRDQIEIRPRAFRAPSSASCPSPVEACAEFSRLNVLPRAGEIQIEARIVRPQPVVSEIVDPAEAERRTEMISFGSMIVNHVENHFDAGRVKIAHHRLELDDLFAELPAAGVLRVRCERIRIVLYPQ